MKPHLLASLALSFGLFAPTAHATLIANYSQSTTAGAYMADIISTDLINQGQATYASGSTNVTPFGSFTFGGLNDGSGATNTTGSNQLKSTFWNSGWPVTLTFNLNLNPGTGGSADGYDITGIQTIGGWTGSFVDQRYTLWVKPVGGPSFVQVGGNFVDTTVNGSTKSTKTAITDNSGVIASGVESVQFIYTAPVNGTANALVIQEIDISGVAIPEPGAALLGGLGLLAFLRRRRA